MAQAEHAAERTMLTSFDPAAGRVVGEVPAATPAEVREAVGRAGRAAPVWWYPYDEATTRTFRAFLDVLAAPRTAEKVAALKSVASNAVRAVRAKL